MSFQSRSNLTWDVLSAVMLGGNALAREYKDLHTQTIPNTQTRLVNHILKPRVRHSRGNRGFACRYSNGLCGDEGQGFAYHYSNHWAEITCYPWGQIACTNKCANRRSRCRPTIVLTQHLLRCHQLRSSSCSIAFSWEKLRLIQLNGSLGASSYHSILVA